jgi:hypothetical protein
MKFSVLASAFISSLIATASAGPLERRYTETPKLFDLTANGLESQNVIWNNVMFANGMYLFHHRSPAEKKKIKIADPSQAPPTSATSSTA